MDLLKEILVEGLHNVKLFAISQMQLIGLAILIYLISFLLLGYSWWSVLLAVLIGLLNIIPLIGPALVFIPWIIINLLQGSFSTAVWLIIIFVGTEIIEDLIQPFMLGDQLNVPFWLPAGVTIICSILFNFWAFWSVRLRLLLSLPSLKC